MDRGTRSILIVGGGAAGWLTAAYLAKALALLENLHLTITVLESPDIGIIGVGEGTFPTIRQTLRFLDIDERRFIRASSATFKQGILFTDWLHEPRPDKRHRFFHPFEAPFYSEETTLVPYWLLQEADKRRSFAEAVTIQDRVAGAKRGPKRPGEPDFDGPLDYAYHIDAHNLAHLLAERAQELGVIHLSGELDHAELGSDGAIESVLLKDARKLSADLYVDCSGFRAELIGRALKSPWRTVRDRLFADRAAACRVPYDSPDSPIESYTLANAHEGGVDLGHRPGRRAGDRLRLFEQPCRRHRRTDDPAGLYRAKFR